MQVTSWHSNAKETSNFWSMLYFWSGTFDTPYINLQTHKTSFREPANCSPKQEFMILHVVFHGWLSKQPNRPAHNPATHRQASHNLAVGVYCSSIRLWVTRTGDAHNSAAHHRAAALCAARLCFVEGPPCLMHCRGSVDQLSICATNKWYCL